MKIELDSIADHINRIDAYSIGQVTVAGTVYKSSLLVSRDIVVPDWPPQRFADLTLRHVEQITALDPEIVILGTGNLLTFPSELLLSPITERAIGLEIMDTGAACRTYNFLIAEGRNVVAALLMMEA